VYVASADVDVAILVDSEAEVVVAAASASVFGGYVVSKVGVLYVAVVSLAKLSVLNDSEEAEVALANWTLSAAGSEGWRTGRLMEVLDGLRTLREGQI
jgi:hypothetical protein